MQNIPDAIFKVKDKMKLAIVLFIMILIILLCNLSLRYSFHTLDEQMNTLYEDRLLPSNYIFNMADIFYRKQLSLGKNETSIDELRMQNDSINSLLKHYEVTYLTKQEDSLFTALQTDWNTYIKMEGSVFDGTEIGMASLNNRLVKMHFLLQQLEKVQLQEGNKLRVSSGKIVKGTQVELQLEISMLIILGVISLVLLSVREKMISKKREAEWLN